MNNKARVSIGAFAVGFALAGAAHAEGVKFMDPTGDDKGAGGYTYPTDAVYTPGSFDLVELEIDYFTNESEIDGFAGGGIGAGHPFR
jgi:carbohydrate-binding DOMON domain-containing protein